MTNAATQTAPKKESAYALVATELRRYDNQLAAALPRHIPSDRFQRILIGALSAQPEVTKAATTPEGKANMIREVMKAAADGIVLDGREGVLTTFNRKKKKKNQSDPDEFYQEIKYMPMVQGILKRMRNSGEVASIECRVVYSNDYFFVSYGDDDKLEHVPWFSRKDEEKSEPGDLKFAYVSALLKDGTRQREVMTRFDIAKVKAASRSKDRNGNVVGPWKDWEDEMWRKAVMHRASKWLPKSSDKETGESVTKILERDNDLYEGFGDVADAETQGEEHDDRDPPASTSTGEGEGGGGQPPADAKDGEVLPPQQRQPRQRRQAEPKEATPPAQPPAPKATAAPTQPANGAAKPHASSAAAALSAGGDDDEDGDLI